MFKTRKSYKSKSIVEKSKSLYQSRVVIQESGRIFFPETYKKQAGSNKVIGLREDTFTRSKDEKQIQRASRVDNELQTQ